MEVSNEDIAKKIVEAMKGSESCVVNKESMKKLTSSLVNKDGKDQSTAEFVDKVCGYVKKEIGNDESIMAMQIFPFLSSTLVNFVANGWPIEMAALVLSNPMMRELISSAALHGFATAKAIDTLGLKIKTVSCSMTQQEIDSLEDDMMKQDLKTNIMANPVVRDMFEKFIDEQKENGGFKDPSKS